MRCRANRLCSLGLPRLSSDAPPKATRGLGRLVVKLDRVWTPLHAGTADPLVSMQIPRFLTSIGHAQLQWLPA